MYNPNEIFHRLRMVMEIVDNDDTDTIPEELIPVQFEESDQFGQSLEDWAEFMERSVTQYKEPITEDMLRAEIEWNRMMFGSMFERICV